MRVNEGAVRVWCLLGTKAGDNAQVRALARELGWGYEEKQVRARPWELLVHLAGRGTLAGIDRTRSSALEPPWPGLVLTAGRRNEPVARWIRARSGDVTRLVHIGRPWAPLGAWDLIVTTPQYFLPQRDNVLHLDLPLHRAPSSGFEAAAAAWRARWAALPAPRIAVLVGGDSGRFVLTPEKGARLGRLVDELARRSGGSLLVTDSPRTPAAACDALESALTRPHLCHRWSPGSDNPYQAMLALADAFVVTGESMSMLAEAADTGRPLLLFDTGDGAKPWWRLRHNYRYKPLSHRFAMRFGPRRMRRDVGRIQEALVSGGGGHWLLDDDLDACARIILAAGRGPEPRLHSGRRALERAAASVRQLVTGC